MSLSRYVRLLAAASGLVVVSLIVSAFACDEGPIVLGPGPSFCTQHGSDGRLTEFVLFPQGPDLVTSFTLSACAFDRIEVPVGDCSLIEWNFPDEGNTPNAVDNQLGGQTYFQYEIGQTCNLQLFSAELDYTLDSSHNPVNRNRFLFNGTWIREFGSGTGPFAVGTWQEVDADFNTLDSGCFDFYETATINVVDRICQFP